MLVLVIQLRKAYSHLARTGTRGGDHHQPARGFHIIVFAVALIADDQVYVGGIIGNGIVVINVQAVSGQDLLKIDRGWLIGKSCQHNGVNIQSAAAENVDQSEYVQIICDTQIAAHLVLFNVVGINNYYDLRFVL